MQAQGSLPQAPKADSASMEGKSRVERKERGRGD